MTRAETATERTSAAILDAAARVLSRRPDAAMADIADAAGVGRATLYRHFPTRESLLTGVADGAVTDLVDAIDAARLDELPADRAIARLAAVFLRTGAKYAALAGLVDDCVDADAKHLVTDPLHALFDRGMRDGTLRNDLPQDALEEMYGALIERALSLTTAGTMTPEQAADAVVTIFLDGARAR
jgi:AcrR family transcriptional regulator